MPKKFGELAPDDVMRTADEFSAALQNVRSIEPQTESLCRSYGNDPQSQPPELVEMIKQLRQAKDSVQEKGRILYQVATQWGVDAQFLKPLAASLQVTLQTENIFRTLESIAMSIKALAFERREGSQQQAAEQAKASSRARPESTHSADYTFVNWYGTEYTFALGVQSSAVKALWDEMETSGLGLHQDTIRNAIDAERDSFRMDTAFRNHGAFGTMIQRCGDGRYRLAPPDAQPSPNIPVKRKSAKHALGSRRKRV
jgi:hypothetical protein